MPDPVGSSQVVHQRDTNKYVSQESRQDRRSHNRVQPLDVENVHCRSKCEPARREHDATQHIKADPDSPRELVVEVRRPTQTFRETDDRTVETEREQREQNQLPESEFHLHCSLSFFPLVFCACGPSAAATSSRRCVIHQTPPNTIPPRGTKSGIRERTR